MQQIDNGYKEKSEIPLVDKFRSEIPNKVPNHALKSLFTQFHKEKAAYALSNQSNMNNENSNQSGQTPTPR